MPDFLHHEPEMKAAPQGADRSASMKGDGARQAARGTETDNGLEELKKKKPPSRLFTQYYGAMFLAITALFIISGFMFLRPLVTEYQSMTINITDAGMTLKDERDYLDSLKASVAAVEAIPSDILSNIDEALPRTVGIPKLLVTMSVIADASGVNLSSISFTTPKSTPSGQQENARGLSVSPVDISLTLSAKNYEATKNFLNRLEHNLRILDVQSINVSGGGEKSFDFTIQLRTYLLTKPTAQAQPGAAPASAS
jgi:hypothetical protein